MVHVAIVGASSGFGRTLLYHFVEQGKHQITVLSRSANSSSSPHSVAVKAVDYDSHSSLVSALQGVHTVIITLASYDDSFRTSQLNVLAAAKEVGVRRIAPSEYALTGYGGIDLYKPKAAVWEAVKQSGLEYTNFACGIFMNGLSTGTPKGEEKALAGLRPWNFIFNVKSGTADIPGDGSSLVTFTEIHDICRFIVASVDLDRWDEINGTVGQTLSFNDVVDIIESVTGRKVLRKTNSKEEMEKSAQDPAKRFYEQVRLALLDDGGVVPDTLNKKLPTIQPVSVREFVEKWWTGVELPKSTWGEDKIFALTAE